MTTATDRFGFAKPTDVDAADLPTQASAIVEKIEDRLAYAGAQGGRSVHNVEQSRTNTAYGVLGTPDRVSGLVLPDAPGLLCVAFFIVLRASVNGAGRVALFVNGVQKSADAADVGGVSGIVTGPVASPVNPAPIVINGSPLAIQHWEIPIESDGAIGDVELRYKATSGTVYGDGRNLFAWTKEFPDTGL